MIDCFSMDFTPVAHPLLQWESSAAVQPPPKRRTSVQATQFTVEHEDVSRLISSRRTHLPATPVSQEFFDGLLGELEGMMADRRTTANSQAAVVSEVDEIAAQRLVLLAAKFAGDKNPDHLARLEILNRRLAAQVPRVTEAQVIALESAVKSGDERRTKIHDLARKFNIKVG